MFVTGVGDGEAIDGYDCGGSVGRGTASLGAGLFAVSVGVAVWTIVGGVGSFAVGFDFVMRL